MAVNVFNSCRDVIPDCDEGFLRDTITTLIANFGIVEVPEDTPFDQIALPADVIEEFTMLVMDHLLNNGYQQQNPEPQVQHEVPEEPANNVAPRQITWEERKAYREESLRVLQNEFKWFYLSAIQRAWQLGDSKYTNTREFLLNLIRPYIGTLNLDAIDPCAPAYPIRNLPCRHNDGRYILHEGRDHFNILLNPRNSRRVVIQSPQLLEEINAIYRSRESKDHSLAEEINFEEHQHESMLIECQCCFTEATFESLVSCGEGHLFCTPCFIEYVNVQIQVGVKRGYLECMENGCEAAFPRSLMKCRLEEVVLQKLDERIAAINVNHAGLTDLVRCPRCQSQFELEADVKVLSCDHCKFQSCRNCHEPWDKEHIGKSCEEIESRNETRLRRSYEEKMTKAIIRQCPRCSTEIVKTEGCNKMACTCGGTLCYVCRAPNIDYSHFCQHARDPGKTCDKCTKCSLWIDSSKQDQQLVQKLEGEAKKKQEEEHAARAEKLAQLKLNQPSTSGLQEQKQEQHEPGPSGDRKRKLSIIDEENIDLSCKASKLQSDSFLRRLTLPSEPSH